MAKRKTPEVKEDQVISEEAAIEIDQALVDVVEPAWPPDTTSWMVKIEEQLTASETPAPSRTVVHRNFNK